MCVCSYVHLTWTANSNLPTYIITTSYFLLYLIIIKIHNFNILPVRSDIYFSDILILEICNKQDLSCIND